MWIGFMWLKSDTGGDLNGEDFVDWLSDYRLLSKDFIP